MGRKSKIDKLGIGPKLCAYAQGGMPHDEIIEKVRREHAGTVLSLNQVSKYLAGHINSIDTEPPPSAIIKQVSIATFRELLLDAINEARSSYEKYRDDPKAGWAWFKHYLDSLNSMGKVVGGYAPENQVNIGVQIDHAADPKCAGCPLTKYPAGTTFRDTMRDWQEYFDEIDREAKEQEMKSNG